MLALVATVSFFQLGQRHAAEAQVDLNGSWDITYTGDPFVTRFCPNVPITQSPSSPPGNFVTIHAGNCFATFTGTFNKVTLQLVASVCATGAPVQLCTAMVGTANQDMMSGVVNSTFFGGSGTFTGVRTTATPTATATATSTPSATSTPTVTSTTTPPPVAGVAVDPPASSDSRVRWQVIVIAAAAAVVVGTSVALRHAHASRL